MKKHYTKLYFIAIPLLFVSMFMNEHPLIMLGLLITGFYLLGVASHYYTASGDEERDKEEARELEVRIAELQKENKIIEDKIKDLKNGKY